MARSPAIVGCFGIYASSIHGGNEFSILQSRLVVILMLLRPLGQLDCFIVNLLVGNLIQQMLDAVQPRPPLII
jgi:hypothetical protein